MTHHATRDRAGRFGRNRRRDGRDVTRLLADFGHDLPTAPIPATEAKQARLFHYVALSSSMTGRLAVGERMRVSCPRGNGSQGCRLVGTGSGVGGRCHDGTHGDLG
jgi:hypothetical protein